MSVIDITVPCALATSLMAAGSLQCGPVASSVDIAGAPSRAPRPSHRPNSPAELPEQQGHHLFDRGAAREFVDVDAAEDQWLALE
ncbi:hypothetical protein M6B22_19020 [Jatrophihabitans cynanchi]|uniref:Secreted protein n=1 Tax=Jatrophihabitans cynanchi TaxID=2944128 RepID=A0ABY7JX77_9ACTN|nr:hypothetical protein [Jatrophihabitans sp. SB3-54]WAX56600.1 hypothetical protein M6B22_19020 [Jatrophihabitans sp. SB3-54]